LSRGEETVEYLSLGRKVSCTVFWASRRTFSSSHFAALLLCPSPPTNTPFLCDFHFQFTPKPFSRISTAIRNQTTKHRRIPPEFTKRLQKEEFPQHSLRRLVKLLQNKEFSENSQSCFGKTSLRIPKAAVESRKLQDWFSLCVVALHVGLKHPFILLFLLLLLLLSFSQFNGHQSL
jgi:hypothetical protein